jgi:hypothetical protein
VLHTLAHDNDRITVDGKLNIPKIIAAHPLLKNVFEEGLEWFVWRESVEIEFPKLPDIIQRALNAKHSVQQAHDHFQVLLRASVSWAGEFGRKPDASMIIAKDIRKCNPKCTANDITALVEIARKYCGDHRFVDPLRSFVATYKQVGRSIASKSLDALAMLKLSPDALCPHFVVSMFMLFAAHPLTTIITSGDIRGITSPKSNKVELLKEAETIIRQMLDVVETMGAPSHSVTKVMGEFRTQMVLAFFGKVGSRGVVDNFVGLASDAFDKSAQLATKTHIANPWASVCASDPPQDNAPSHDHEASQNREPSVIEYQDGKAVGIQRSLLLGRGYHNDCVIRSKETGVRVGL